MSNRNLNLGQQFEQISKHNPTNIALRYSDVSLNLTYCELNLLANQWAHFLLKMGINKGQVVCILNTKSPFSFALMLACLKTGVAYANIDEESPIKRLEKILNTCEPSLIFSDVPLFPRIRSICSDLGIQAIECEKAFDLLDPFSIENPSSSSQITGSTIAYIMFTSGSTGVPKGVAISHDNLFNFISWGSKRFNISSSDIFANPSPMYFDNSVFDVYIALFSGASLAPISKSVAKSPPAIVEHINKFACTVWFSVPSLLMFLNTFKVLTKESFKSIRLIVFGGEGYPKKELKKIYDTYSKNIEFVNVYGPTEGTCICSSYDVGDADFRNTEGILPIGNINPNFDYLVLSSSGDKVENGITGELCLLGPNIAHGYYNDQIKTTEAFVTNPHQTKLNELMYKTGDLVFIETHSKVINFVGRKDNQIKHMGYRIELDEIEHALNNLTYLSQAAVIYKQVNTTIGKIYAYVSGEKVNPESRILQDLKLHLPYYMLPNEVIYLDKLPINQNGKIDRSTLKNKN